MLWIELSCILLLLLGLALRARTPGLRDWARDAPIILVGAWLAEDTCIRAYAFYDYHAPWHLVLDKMPLLIAAIWIFVVLSARDVAAQLAPKRTILLVFLLVWYDASLIEPIATHVGLWRWHELGPFNVPWIGMLGWAIYAAAVLGWLQRLPQHLRWLAVIFAPFTTHVVLLCLWWGALRWLPQVRPSDGAMTVGSAVIASGLAFFALRSRRRVLLSLLLPRIGPALFFFALLWLYAAPLSLVLYSLAFALPWLAVTRWSAVSLQVRQSV